MYDPEAKEILAQLYVEIFECEMKLNHPIAGHAAVQLALRCSPNNENLRKGISTVFGKDNPNLPFSATHTYDFKPLPANASAERRTAWGTALKTVSTSKLTDAVRGFEKLTESPSAEGAAWYNLALAHAWLGNNYVGRGSTRPLRGLSKQTKLKQRKPGPWRKCCEWGTAWKTMPTWSSIPLLLFCATPTLSSSKLWEHWNRRGC